MFWGPIPKSQWQFRQLWRRWNFLSLCSLAESKVIVQQAGWLYATMETEKIRLGEMRSPAQVISWPLLFPSTSYLPVHNRASTFGEREDTPGWRKRTTAVLGSPHIQHCPSSGQEHSGETEAQRGQATQTCSTVAPSRTIVLPAELPTSSWCHFCKS